MCRRVCTCVGVYVRVRAGSLCQLSRTVIHHDVCWWVASVARPHVHRFELSEPYKVLEGLPASELRYDEYLFTGSWEVLVGGWCFCLFAPSFNGCVSPVCICATLRGHVRVRDLLEEIRTYIDMEKTEGPYREYWKCLAHLCRHELASAEEVRAGDLLIALAGRVPAPSFGCSLRGVCQPQAPPRAYGVLSGPCVSCGLSAAEVCASDARLPTPRLFAPRTRGAHAQALLLASMHPYSPCVHVYVCVCVPGGGPGGGQG